MTEVGEVPSDYQQVLSPEGADSSELSTNQSTPLEMPEDVSQALSGMNEEDRERFQEIMQQVEQEQNVRELSTDADVEDYLRSNDFPHHKGFFSKLFTSIGEFFRRLFKRE